MSLPARVKIYEVGPRDGLQNEKAIVPTATKIELIERLANAGLEYIEASSFVSPKWVPQMGDAAEVFAGLKPKEGVTYSALVPNDRGMDGAVAAGVEEIAVFAAASESFSQKNINCSIEESFERFAPVIQRANNQGMFVRGYVSCVAGCPYEGAIDESAVVKVAAKLFDMGCYEISLGDTIGVGTPEQIKSLVKAVKAHDVPIEKIALHCHDTYGQALANIYAGLQEGVTVIDSAVGGLGGCPYAKGASGNVATEDVLYMLNGLGIETGADINAIVDTAWFISDYLGIKPHSKVACVGRTD